MLEVQYPFKTFFRKIEVETKGGTHAVDSGRFLQNICQIQREKGFPF